MEFNFDKEVEGLDKLMKRMEEGFRHGEDKDPNYRNPGQVIKDYEEFN